MPDPSLRLRKLRGLLADRHLDALIVSSLPNVRYLSGFTGSSAALLVDADHALLITDSRYAEQSAAEAPGFDIDVSPGVPALVAARSAGPRRVAFEAEAASYALWEQMRGAAEKSSAQLAPVRGLVESLRARKEPDEVALITRAVEITSAAFEEVLPMVVPGAVERDLALELELRMKRAGAEDVAFDLIVASGPRSALPHGRASEKRLSAGEFVVFDIGARYKGYHSDMTRTVFLGNPGSADSELYNTVLSAQLDGIAAAKSGVAAGDVDAASRRVIDAAGHGSRFGHGTGHGVGLAVHEAPRVGQRSEEVLEEGMTITVEPGIYVQGRGGVRIEDIVLVTREGCRVLTPTPKDRWILE